MTLRELEQMLGDESKTLLEHRPKIGKERLHLPGPDFVDRVWMNSDRSPAVLRNLQLLFNTGRLAETGYVSILPVDQGIEHSAGASVSHRIPTISIRENIVKLAIEGGCNARRLDPRRARHCRRKYAHKIPFIVKLNHNELLTYPNKYDQIMFGSVKQAYDMGAVGVGATIYFGSEESDAADSGSHRTRSPHAHELGMFTDPLVLSAQRRVQDQDEGFPRRRRPHRAGQSPGRDDRGRHHQAEAAGEQRRLRRAQVRQDRPEVYTKLTQRPSDRPVPLSGRQLLHGPQRADQLRRRVEGGRRSGRSRAAPRSSTNAPAAWA